MGDKHETCDPPQLDGVFQQRGRNHVRLRPWGWVIFIFARFTFIPENINRESRYRFIPYHRATRFRVEYKRMEGGIVRLGDSWTKCQHEFSVLPRLLCTLPFKPTRCARWFIARWTSHAALACNYFHVTVVRIKLSSSIERVFALPRVTRVLVRPSIYVFFSFFFVLMTGKVLRFTEISQISFPLFFFVKYRTIILEIKPRSKVIIIFSSITMFRGNFFLVAFSKLWQTLVLELDGSRVGILNRKSCGISINIGKVRKLLKARKLVHYINVINWASSRYIFPRASLKCS